MKVDIKVPTVGESITEATIAEWSKQTGDYVNRDEILLVLETDKASVEVVAEQAGQLSIKVEEGEVVEMGAVVGEIDTSASAPAGAAQPEAAAPSQPAAGPSPAPATAGGAHPELQQSLSPATRRVVAENKLDPAQIQGTGRGGRLTKGDALQAASSPASAPTAGDPKPAQELPPMPVANGRAADAEEWREPMSNIRKRIAERLVQSQQTAAILTTFNEIDMTEAMSLRAKYKEDFKEKHGISLGFMGIFVKASIAALKAFPKVNASIDGTDTVFRNFVNMGIAVGTPKGLMVPVIKHADRMSLAEIELAIRHYALKARDGKIGIDDLSGGTFTISNGGVYGSLMSTPIINPPQTGILGMHKIEERPMAIKGEIKIRPMMYVALSYDHRIIDGSESVQFLVKIKEGVEDPARLLLEI